MPAACSAVRTATRSVGLGDDLEGLAEVVDVLGAGLEGRLEDVVLGDGPALLRRSGTMTTPLRLNRKDTEPGSASEPPLRVIAVRTSIAARLLVVGEALDEHRDAGGAVALVHDRLVVGAAGLGARSRA